MCVDPCVDQDRKVGGGHTAGSLEAKECRLICPVIDDLKLVLVNVRLQDREHHADCLVNRSHALKPTDDCRSMGYILV